MTRIDPSSWDLAVKHRPRCVREIRGSVPSDAIDRLEMAAVDHYVRTTKLRGFRRGRAPLHMVRRLYGAEIRDDAIDEAIGRAVLHVVKENDFKLIEKWKVVESKRAPGEPLFFRVHMVVRPEVKLARDGGFVVQRKVPVIDDRLLDGCVDGLRALLATLEEDDNRTESGPPTAGDVVEVRAFPQGEEEDDEEGGVARAPVGCGILPPEVEARILGMEEGDEAPLDADAWPGRGSVSRIRLREIVRRRRPSAERLAKEIYRFDSVDEFRETVARTIREDARRKTDAETRAGVKNLLRDANPVEIPEMAIGWARERIVHGLRSRFPGDLDLDSEDSALRAASEEQAKDELIMSKLIKRYKVSVSKERLTSSLKMFAASLDMDVNEFWEMLEAHNRSEDFIGRIVEEEALDLVLSRSAVEEVPVPAAESIHDLSLQKLSKMIPLFRSDLDDAKE